MIRTSLLSLLVLLFLAPMHTFAQKAKIRSGILAQESNKSDQAVSLLTEGLANATPEEAKPDLMAKGYLRLSQAYMDISITISNPDLASLSPYTATFSDKKPELPVLAHEALQKAKEYDSAGAFKNEIKQEGERIWRGLYSESFTFSKGNDFSTAISYLDKAETYFDTLWYQVPLLKGFHYLGMQDTLRSINSFRIALPTFWADTASVREAGPDGIKQIYANISILYQSYQGDPAAIYNLYVLANDAGGEVVAKDAFIATLQSEKPVSYTVNPAQPYEEASTVPGVNEALLTAFHAFATQQSYEVITEGVNKYPKDEVIQNQYAVILQRPEFKEKGKEFFKRQLENDPTNVRYMTQYAELIVDEDPAMAKKYYQKALEIDPNDIYALYNLAVLLNNEASARLRDYNTLNDSGDRSEATLAKLDEIKADVERIMRGAESYALRAHKVDPQQCAPVQLLAGIYGFLNDEAKYNEFTELKKQVCN